MKLIQNVPSHSIGLAPENANNRIQTIRPINDSFSADPSTSPKFGHIAGDAFNFVLNLDQWLKKRTKEGKKEEMNSLFNEQAEIIKTPHKSREEINEALEKLRPAIVAEHKKHIITISPQSMDLLAKHSNFIVRQSFLEQVLMKMDFDINGKDIGEIGQAVIINHYLDLFSNAKKDGDGIAPAYMLSDLRSLVLDVIEKMDKDPLPKSFKSHTPNLYKKAPYPRYTFAEAFSNDPDPTLKARAIEIMKSSSKPTTKKA